MMERMTLMDVNNQMQVMDVKNKMEVKSNYKMTKNKMGGDDPNMPMARGEVITTTTEPSDVQHWPKDVIARALQIYAKRTKLSS
eukprot:369254-Amphidinium_carterae.1